MKKFRKFRQAVVLERLEEQLLSGKKTANGTRYVEVDLTAKDIVRIKYEILALKHRV